MSRETVTAIAHEHLNRGDMLGWFEEVYRVHRADTREIPWADFAPNDLLVSWLNTAAPTGRACVVGCGLGDDAAELARRGMRTAAFDLSPTAIDLARERFPEIDFHALDLFELRRDAADWVRQFAVVFEAYTLQSLPARIRRKAFEEVAELVAPGGELVAVARLREETDPVPEAPPWPLTSAELKNAPPGLVLETFEEHPPSDKHPARRARCVYRRS